jgi:hypothetical protein
MTTIYGALGINDNERVFLSTLGQSIVYDAIAKVTAEHNADLQLATSLFVQGQTTDFAKRYKLPGGGYMQRIGKNAPAGAVKTSGSWDVAFPLEGFGDTVASNRIDYAYMTTADLANVIENVRLRNMNTHRREILRALLRKSPSAFLDEIHGSLAIQGLANGDSVLYPPVIGSDTEATDDHYTETGYLVSGISSSNDPFPAIVAELEEHFGAPTGGSNIVCFTPAGATAYILAMGSKFVPVSDTGIKPGDDIATVLGLPSVTPGRVLGRHSSGCWIVEWRALPTTHGFALHLDAEKPVMKRVDPVDTGIAPGLQLVATDTSHPMTSSYWEDRFGYAVANRLNGVAVEFGTGGSYTDPSGY